MQEIEKLRAELDGLHQELFGLLQKRFAITEKIWKVKIEQQLPFTDMKREESVLNQFDSLAENDFEKQAVQEIMKSIIVENKKYLEAKLKNEIK